MSLLDENGLTRVWSKMKTWVGTKVQTDVPANAVFTDTKVTQTESTTNENYEVLLSGIASTATSTEGANKNEGLLYNPNKKAFTVGTRALDQTIGANSIAEGVNVVAQGTGSHAEGNQTKARGQYSHAEGTGAYANGLSSHAEGWSTTSSGFSSHSEGNFSYAGGGYAHVEGNKTTAIGSASHAEGEGTYAEGSYSHAEGFGSCVTNQYGHAEGYYSKSYGDASHAEGYNTTVSGSYSHAEGYRTAASHKSQHVFGEYNLADASTATTSERGTYVEIVGNGTSSTHSNARTLDWSGNEVLSGKLTVGAAPTNDMDVATKKYVDDAVTAAITQVLAAQY